MHFISVFLPGDTIEYPITSSFISITNSISCDLSLVSMETLESILFISLILLSISSFVLHSNIFINPPQKKAS